MFMLSTAVRLWDEPRRRPGSFVAKLRTRLARGAAAIRREHGIRRDAAHLASLGDHMLRDIGIRRGEIERRLRFGRDAARPQAPGDADLISLALLPFPSASDCR